MVLELYSQEDYICENDNDLLIMILSSQYLKS